jgi:inner membrane protein
MDSLTHIALGAGVGALLGGRALGRKALVLGAVAQSLPDIDFLAGLWCNPAEDLLAHRGFTHSFLCIVLLAPLLSAGASRLYASADYSYKRWLAFYCRC